MPQLTRGLRETDAEYMERIASTLSPDQLARAYSHLSSGTTATSNDGSIWSVGTAEYRDRLLATLSVPIERWRDPRRLFNDFTPSETYDWTPAPQPGYPMLTTDSIDVLGESIWRVVHYRFENRITGTLQLTKDWIGSKATPTLFSIRHVVWCKLNREPPAYVRDIRIGVGGQILTVPEFEPEIQSAEIKIDCVLPDFDHESVLEFTP